MRPERPTAEDELSFHRSRKRREAVTLLSSLGEAFPRQLAMMLRVDPSRLKHIMQGGGSYAADLSPVALGHCVIVPTARSYKYVIAPRGRRKARQWTARVARRSLKVQMIRKEEPAPEDAGER